MAGCACGEEAGLIDNAWVTTFSYPRDRTVTLEKTR